MLAGIRVCMRVRWVLCLLSGLLVWGLAEAVDGTFRGRIVNPPASEKAVPGWIFVQGKNQMLRRVEVAHAQIVFSEEVPVSQRRKCNSECLSPGQEVRITAYQDQVGEWRAKRVEILKFIPAFTEKPLKAGALPNFTHFWPPAQITNRAEFCIATSTGEIYLRYVYVPAV
jgi:hypothetical protein